MCVLSSSSESIYIITSWTLFLYQLLSPCLFSGCGFVISVALTGDHLTSEPQGYDTNIDAHDSSDSESDTDTDDDDVKQDQDFSSDSDDDSVDVQPDQNEEQDGSDITTDEMGHRSDTESNVNVTEQITADTESNVNMEQITSNTQPDATMTRKRKVDDEVVDFTLQNLIDRSNNGEDVLLIPRPKGTGSHNFNIRRCISLGNKQDAKGSALYKSILVS